MDIEEFHKKKQKARETWNKVKEIYQHECSDQRIQHLLILAEEIIVDINTESVPNFNDVKEIAIGIYQFVSWMKRNETAIK